MLQGIGSVNARNCLKMVKSQFRNIRCLKSWNTKHNVCFPHCRQPVQTQHAAASSGPQRPPVPPRPVVWNVSWEPSTNSDKSGKQSKGFQCSRPLLVQPLESKSLLAGLGAKRHWTQIWWYPNVLLLAAGCVCASSTSPPGFINQNLMFNLHRIEPVRVSENRTRPRCCLAPRPQRN